MDVISDQGEKYIVTFTDVGSRYTFVMPVRRRSGVLNDILAPLKYTNTTFGDHPILMNYENAKEFRLPGSQRRNPGCDH